jgi:hypothetical protein
VETDDLDVREINVGWRGFIFERLVDAAVVLIGGLGLGRGLIRGSWGMSKVLEIGSERSAITGVGSGTISFVFWERVMVLSDCNLESGSKILARVSLEEGGAVRSGIVGTNVKGWAKVGRLIGTPSGFSSLVGEEE